MNMESDIEKVELSSPAQAASQNADADDPIQRRAKRWWEWILPLKGVGLFFREFGEFLWERKLWWMMPIVFFLMLLSVLLVMAKGSVFAPFLYTLF